MKRIGIHVILLICICFLVGSSAYATSKIQVFVSILPQQYFVQQIGKNLVATEVMVQPGASPHTYEPKPSQMIALSKARIYFSIGVPFENTWLNKIASTNPNLLFVATDEKIDKIPMLAHHHENEEKNHGKEPGSYHHNHHHEGIPDPHIWLSPPLVKIQAQAIVDALKKVDPKNRSVYETNFNHFISEIDLLHVDLTNALAGKEGTPFVVFHPSWGYFAKTYGLRQIPIEIEGKDPKPAQLMELIRYSKKQQIKVIFVQPQFSVQSAQVIAREIDGEVVFIDPLAPNWEENLRKVAGIFQRVLH